MAPVLSAKSFRPGFEKKLKEAFGPITAKAIAAAGISERDVLAGISSLGLFHLRAAKSGN